jgi:hypothetical protein
MKIMRLIIASTIVLATTQAFAEIKNAKLTLEIQGTKSNPCNCDGVGFGLPQLKIGRETIEMAQNGNAFIDLKGNQLVVSLNKKDIVLGNIEQNKVDLFNSLTAIRSDVDLELDAPKDLLTANEDVLVNIITNKEEKKFKATLCSHMGCFPYPHVESTFRQLIEIDSINGEKICYNRNVLKNKPTFSLGKCL